MPSRAASWVTQKRIVRNVVIYELSIKHYEINHDCDYKK